MRAAQKVAEAGDVRLSLEVLRRSPELAMSFSRSAFAATIVRASAAADLRTALKCACPPMPATCCPLSCHDLPRCFRLEGAICGSWESGWSARYVPGAARATLARMRRLLGCLCGDMESYVPCRGNLRWQHLWIGNIWVETRQFHQVLLTFDLVATSTLEVMKASGLRPNRDIAFHITQACFECGRPDLAVAYCREFEANGLPPRPIVAKRVQEAEAQLRGEPAALVSARLALASASHMARKHMQ